MVGQLESMRLRTRLEALRTAIFTEVKIMPVTKPVTGNLQVHFASLTDPRRRKIPHPLLNFIVIAICAVICGADDFVAIADFGRRKRTWFPLLHSQQEARRKEVRGNRERPLGD
jgi:hypothetical protein